MGLHVIAQTLETSNDRFKYIQTDMAFPQARHILDKEELGSIPLYESQHMAENPETLVTRRYRTSPLLGEGLARGTGTKPQRVARATFYESVQRPSRQVSYVHT
jgi:hypothetical protein